MGSPKSWSLALRVFHLVLAQHKYHWKFFCNTFHLKRIPIFFLIYSSPLQKVSSCHGLWRKFSSKPISLFWLKPSTLFQQVSTPFRFYSNYFILKIIFCHLFGLGWFTKELPIFLWILIPNKLLWLVLSTLNQDPSRSTGPQFKIFKICLLQVWTRFAIFGEIHSFSSPKNLR